MAWSLSGVEEEEGEEEGGDAKSRVAPRDVVVGFSALQALPDRPLSSSTWFACELLKVGDCCRRPTDTLCAIFAENRFWGGEVLGFTKLV